MDSENKILTRSQIKKLEDENSDLSLSYLEVCITKTILTRLLTEVKGKKNINVKALLDALEKSIKSNEFSLKIEYDNNKKLTEDEELEVGSVELTSEFFKNLIKHLKSENRKRKNFNLKKYLIKLIKEYNDSEKEILKRLKKIEKILSRIPSKNEKKKKRRKRKNDSSNSKNHDSESEDDDSDVDSKGNIKGLISYSSESEGEEEEEDDDESIEKSIREYGKYVHRLKGKDLDKFVKNTLKSKDKSNYDSDLSDEMSDSDYSDDESDDDEFLDDELDDEYLIELLGDKWNKKDLQYLKLRHGNNDDKKRDMNYFRGLDEDGKDEILELIEKINLMNDEHKPLFLKVIDSKMKIENKAMVIKKLEAIDKSDSEVYSGEYFKLKYWVESLLKIPFNEMKKELVSSNNSKKEIRNYLKRSKEILDNAVYGHDDAKRHILRILAQNISNDKSKGNVFGIQGPMGNGKTTLVEEGISKAIGRPFAFLSLGGATDACYLEGHSYTYEGSTWGGIIDVLMKSKCMNPVIYFDELDKVSETAKGNEIINILMHLTDPSQNSHFHDKYFQGIDFDVSKAIFIFSYNDLGKINPILRDRIVNIETKGFRLEDKIQITNKYLLPKVAKDIGMKKKDIHFDDNVIEELIKTYTCEGGVRKLKEHLYEIIREINLRNLKGDKINMKKISFPLKITNKMIKEDFFKKKYEFKIDKIIEKPMVGIINGLYATENSNGGLTIVETKFNPSDSVLSLELTGQQGDIMKESMSVAKSVAWNLLEDKIQNDLLKKWKSKGNMGIHIHCPEGATPKDGPSAGCAITCAIYSLLSDYKINNSIAITGEINLAGNVTEIGGLESKLFGAKDCGVKKVLIPKDNEKDLIKIKKQYKNLVSNDFEVICIETIHEALEQVILKKNNDDGNISTTKKKRYSNNTS